MSISSERSMNGRSASLALVVYCGLLMGMSAFSIDVMLPAFLPMANDLNTSLAVVQSSIPAYMGAFAVAQLFYGAASDRFGRRPVIAVGLLVYLVGAAISAFGQTIEIVLAGRALQGFGGAAAPVVARAILRDTHSGAALGGAMATATGVFALGPICAPLVGYGFEASYGWRFIFIAMGGIALTLLVANFFLFKETNTEKNPDAMKLASIWGAFRRMLLNRQSLVFLLIAGAAMCGLLSYIANSSRLYATSFGATGFEFASLFMISGFGIVLGQFANRWALRRFGILTALRFAGFIVFFVSCLNGIFAYTGHLTALMFTLLMFGYNTSYLVVAANSTTLIIDPHPGIAGMVSAFVGFTTILIASAYLVLTFDLYDGDALKWSIGMIIANGIAFLIAMTARRDRMQYQDS